MDKLRNRLLKLLFQIDSEEMRKQIVSVEIKTQKIQDLQKRLASQLCVIEQLNKRAAARENVIKSYELTLDPEMQKKIHLNFEICRVENDVGADTWKVITSYCKPGCEQEGYSFNSQWRATQKAIELTLQGFFPVSVSSCAKCYEEYLHRCM